MTVRTDPPSSRARHRRPGRALWSGRVLAERTCLGLALLGSAAAVVLTLDHRRGEAVAVATLALLLALTGFGLGLRGLRRRAGAS